MQTQRSQKSIRCLQGVWKRSWRLTTKPDVFITSGRRRRIYNVLKTSDLCSLEDVHFRTSCWRRIYVVLKTSNLRRYEGVWFNLSWGQRLCRAIVAVSIHRQQKWKWSHCARRRFLCILWEHQWSWESKTLRKFLKFIKVFGLKKNFSKILCLGDSDAFVHTFSEIWRMVFL